MALKSHLTRILMYLAIVFAIAAPMLPREALAIEHYTGTVVGQCTTMNGVTTNVTATVTAPNWYASGLTYTFQPGNHVLSGASGVDPNDNKIARFSLPPGTYTVTVGNPDLQGTYTITVPNCVSPIGGSLSVIKTVVNTTGIDTTNVVFPVDVSCGHTIHTTLNLGNAGGYQQTVQHITVPAICTIQEHTIAAPPGCHWNTTYPHGQSVGMGTQPMGYLIPVQNELVCASHCPPGTTEQTFPGTHVKFCCDHKLNPESNAFCCKREPTEIPKKEDEKASHEEKD